MKKIRNNVFETNSSSTHSLSIKLGESLENFNIPLNNIGVIEANFGEYGWGYDILDTQEAKLSYLLTMVAMTELGSDIIKTKISARDRFINTDGFQKLNNFAKQHCNGISDSICSQLAKDAWHQNSGFKLEIDGYIDHQSCEDYNSLQDFLDDYNISIDEIILNPTAHIIIDNDNRY